MTTFVFMATFGDRVREERQAKGWSYQELADRVSKAAGVKVPRVTIEKIEDRSSRMSKWSSAIAAALGVDHDWLVNEIGTKAGHELRLKRLKALPPDLSEDLGKTVDALLNLKEQEARDRKRN